MGQSSGSDHTTTTTEPPKYVQPYLQYGAQQARSLYNSGGPEYYPGQTVVPMADQTQQGLLQQQQQATAGSPTTGAASTYAQGVLGGDYLPGQGKANPYLDATFNQAADATRTQLDSQFAGSGRNLSAAMPARADQLNQLATNIYGGAYEGERQRQQAMIPFAPSLDNQGYTDAQRLQEVGAQYEDLTGRNMEDAAARWDFGQNQPYTNLDRYLGQLGQSYTGGMSDTATPIHRNRTAGALGGAASGASMGASVGGPYGALIGGAAGGLLGAFG